MLVWVAVAVLCLALVGLSTIIILDVRDKGWTNWLATVGNWQNMIGAVAGFISAASVLLLSSAIQDNVEQARAQRASYAIGQALAYEVERMLGPLQRAYPTAQTIDRTAPDVADRCKLLMRTLRDTMLVEPPVYDAVLADTLDFGADNLALFTRVYGYYSDFHTEIANNLDKQCEVDPVGRLDYVVTISQGAFQYYQHVMAAYPAVTPLQPGMIDDAGQPAETP